MIEGALQCALRGGTTYFICAFNSGWYEDKNKAAGENVLGVALEIRFENTGVEVVTPRQIRKELGWSRRKRTGVPALIRDFLKHRLTKQKSLARSVFGILVNAKLTTEENSFIIGNSMLSI